MTRYPVDPRQSAQTLPRQDAVAASNSTPQPRSASGFFDAARSNSLHAMLSLNRRSNNANRSRAIETSTLMLPLPERSPEQSNANAVLSYTTTGNDMIDDNLRDAFELFDRSVQRQVVQRAPPASVEAIVNLPCTRVFPSRCKTEESNEEDLSHKECSVCMELLPARLSIVRLPCGHVYHLTCIVQWLHQTCTCPECRYELQTDDPEFEMGRKERMKGRATVACTCHQIGGHNKCSFHDKFYCGTASR
jgi:hypothetical protein